MPHTRRLVVDHRLVPLLLLLSTLGVPGLAAQWPPVQPQAQCQEGCGGEDPPPPYYAVDVTPDGGSGLNVTAFAGGSYSFWVQNTGTIDDTYTLTCLGPGVGASCSVSPSSLFLAYGNGTYVTANYVAGAAGTGSLALQADGQAEDGGFKNATITGRGYPVLTDTAQNSTYLDRRKCVEGCFQAVYAHSTPAYISMGVPRSLTLVYNSATHRPSPTVTVDVTENAYTTPAPTSYSIRVQYNGVWLTLLNDSTFAYYTHAPGGPTRLVAAFDALANGLTTGRYQVVVAVKAFYASGGPLESTITTNVLINDQSKSVFGSGVSLGEYQRLINGVVTEGDGSVVSLGSSTSRSPGAPDSWIELKPGNPASARYVRTYMDGSYANFNTSGFMTLASDRFGSATTYTYYAAPYDTLLWKVVDPMGKEIRLCYDVVTCNPTNVKLKRFQVLPGLSPGRITDLTHDGSGRLIRVRDPDFLSDSLAYGGNGLLATIWNRARRATDLTYDALRQVKTIQAPSATLYSGTGRPTISYSPVQTSVWRPDSAGWSLSSRKPGVTADTSLKSLITDPLGNTTRFSQDRFGAPTKITDSYGATVRITRDLHSRPLRIDEPTGYYTLYSYNWRDQMTGTTDGPTGRSINYFYRDTLSSDLAYMTGDLVRQDFTYYLGGDGGPAGALKKVYVGNNTATWPNVTGSQLVGWHRPDNLGRDTALLDSLGHGTHYVYESNWGNVWKVKDPSGVEVRFTYDTAGRVDSTFKPLSSRTKVTYGAMNQVLSQTWSGNPGYKVTNTYDSLLAVVKVETPRASGTSGPVTYLFKYNELGALVARNDAADTSKVERLSYDSAGNLRRIVSRRGDTLSLSFDKVGRLLSRIGQSSAGLVDVADYFKYDTLMLRWSSDSNAVAVNRDTIDHRGRLVQWTQMLNGRTYTGIPTYDTYDRVTRRVIKPSSPAADSSVMTYAFAGGTGVRTTTCAFWATKCMSITRKGDFIADTIKYNPGTGNEWKVVQANDANHRVTGLDYSITPGLDPIDITFLYDSLGRLRNRTSPKTGFTRRILAYDSLGALVNACDSTGSQCQNVVNGGTSGNAWAYDSAGNRIAEAGTSGITYGPGNRVQSYGGKNYSYDANGSVTCAVAGTCAYGPPGYRYGWDALGRLREVKDAWTGALIDSMYYDARGRRVTKKMASAQEYYVYEGSQVILDVDASGTVLREYAWNPGTVDRLLAMRSASPVDTLVAVLDPRLGTVRGMARFRTGALVKRYGEGPWGEVAADTGLASRYRFAGRERDSESGLYYMRARYYDASTGRWISEDPIGIAGGAGLYLYSGNDPVNLRDPSGLVLVCGGLFGGPDGEITYCRNEGHPEGDFFHGDRDDGRPGNNGDPDVGLTKVGGADPIPIPLVLWQGKSDTWKGCTMPSIVLTKPIIGLDGVPEGTGIFQVDYRFTLGYNHRNKPGEGHGPRVPVPGGIGHYSGKYYGPVGGKQMMLPAIAEIHCASGRGFFAAYVPVPKV